MDQVELSELSGGAKDKQKKATPIGDYYRIMVTDRYLCSTEF
jgi:hypothetical protein